jgi:phosphoribosylamine--glycine ligase
VKVLIIGGGGREHALAWQLTRDDPALDLVAAPGNPGIAELARCVAAPVGDPNALVALAEAERPDLTIVGPEAPLEAGVVDRFQARGLAVFGPTRAAAEIETSKRFAKSLMLAAGVPTARAEHHTDAAAAKQAVRRFGAPVVIKASGLAAGKGVVVALTEAEADDAVERMLVRGAFGEAGAEILVEEFMLGEELSLFAITDGTHVLPMLAAQDHKRLLAGDVGPNTGGMGAYAPVSIGGPDLVSFAVDRVFLPTLAAMRERGRPFTGLLYAGLMLTPDGPRVVEFNCRFGDPETQAILPLLASSLAEPLLAVARGESLAGASPLTWRAAHAVTTVVAAAGYPDEPRRGDAIVLPPAPPDVHVFHAGTARGADGALRSAGGRVLTVTAVADTLAQAQRLSVAHASAVELSGRQLRADIGWRELVRGDARAS